MAAKIHFQSGGAALPSDNITGTGTINQVAKFTGANIIGDSIISADNTKAAIDGDLNVNDVYSNQLYTNIGEAVANITSYTESSGTVFQPLDGPPTAIDEEGTAFVDLSDYNNSALPTFNSGDEFILKNTDNSEVVLQWDFLFGSDSETAVGYTIIISGTLTGDYTPEVGFDGTSTTINIDTDLTATVNIGDNILLGGLTYTVNAITSSSITVGALVTNIEFIDTVDLANDFPLLSYKSTLSNGNNVAKTPILSYNLAKNRTFLRGNIDFFGSNENQFIGKDSGLLNTTGLGNTAIGFESIKNNSEGLYNTALGYKTLSLGTYAGYGNTAIGYLALLNNRSDYNTAIGADAMKLNTTGVSNVAIGSSSLGQNSTGSQNVGIGNGALFGSNGTSGEQNVAIGMFSGNRNRGLRNVAVGFESFVENTTGNDNVAIGYQALSRSTTPSSNTGIGAQSMRFVSTGGQNVGVGWRTLYSTTTGSNNTAIGYSANVTTASAVGNILLGAFATTSSNNQFVVGSSSVNAGAVITQTNTSSKYWQVVINGTTQKILLA